MKIANYIEKEKALRRVTYALYIYFFLLIFEGALRRWVLPGFSAPLLVIRDPIAIYILITAWQFHFIKINGYLIGLILISFISLNTTFFFGHGNIFIAIYGLRILLIHFPLLFVIESVFKKKEIFNIAKWMIYLSIPMFILIVFQFYSPQSAWVNKGLGENFEGGGFVGALGYYRPPGTFSFTNGVVLFFTFVSPFVLWGFTDKINIPKWVLYLSLFCLILSIPFSISRALLFATIATSIFFMFFIFRNILLFFRIIFVVIAIFTSLYFLSASNFLGTSINVFKERFTTANETEGGLENVIFVRYLGGLKNAFNSSGSQPIWGQGIGMGTNVAGQLISGKREFLIAEGEWGRVLGELGPILGLLFILIRIVISIKMARIAFLQFLSGNILPWLLAANVIINIIQGQWAQPTSLGFSIFFGGVLLASRNLREAPNNV